MKEVDLGKTYLPESIIEEVEDHRRKMLLANPNSDYYSDCYEFMKNASFSMWLSDYLLKYGYKLLH